MGPTGPRFELIYHDDIVYEDWIGSWFTLMHKVVFVIMQCCIGDNEQVLWIGLTD